jgi:hypothetical protein
MVDYTILVTAPTNLQVLVTDNIPAYAIFQHSLDFTDPLNSSYLPLIEFSGIPTLIDMSPSMDFTRASNSSYAALLASSFAY